MDPESCLRSLTAEALLWAHPGRPLFPLSLGVMAVANAFVMLGPPRCRWAPVNRAHEGSGAFRFWPPVSPKAKQLRVTVSTLWEAAWALIDIPGR